jgi:predicted nucleic acid-binding protein
MDKPSVYIETSIVSYLAADPSRHSVTLRNQQLTHAWWNTRRDEYELFTSELVVSEAADGNPRLAQRRLALLAPIQLLDVEVMEAEQFANELRIRVPMPPQAYADAMHIAAAALRGMAHVLTWNCKHIANPRLQPRIRRVCEALGYNMPVLCTPADLR